MKQSRLVFFILMIIVFQGCHTVNPGYKAVKVYLLGTDKGVNEEALGVGRYGLGINTEYYDFPVFLQNYVWTKGEDEGSENNEEITFQTKNGLSVDLDVGISFTIVEDEVAKVFQTYRKGIEEITDGELRNNVRDLFHQYGSYYDLDSLMSGGKTSLFDSVEVALYREVIVHGIEIEDLYMINMRPPNSVLEALNAKIQSEQKRLKAETDNITMVQNAEAKKKAMILEAEGEAESIRIKSQALSKNKNIIELRWIEKWNGAMPQVSSSRSDGLILNLNKK